MRIGFIGLGNVGGKLAGSLMRNGYALMVRDLDKSQAQAFLDKGATWAETPQRNGRILRVHHHLPAVTGGIGGGDGKR